VADPPEKIYIQWFGDGKPPDSEERPEEVTWSEDRVFDSDIVYVRLRRKKRGNR